MSLQTMTAPAPVPTDPAALRAGSAQGRERSSGSTSDFADALGSAVDADAETNAASSPRDRDDPGSEPAAADGSSATGSARSSAPADPAASTAVSSQVVSLQLVSLQAVTPPAVAPQAGASLAVGQAADPAAATALPNGPDPTSAVSAGAPVADPTISVPVTTSAAGQAVPGSPAASSAPARVGTNIGEARSTGGIAGPVSAGSDAARTGSAGAGSSGSGASGSDGGRSKTSGSPAGPAAGLASLLGQVTAAAPESTPAASAAASDASEAVARLGDSATTALQGIAPAGSPAPAGPVAPAAAIAPAPPSGSLPERPVATQLAGPIASLRTAGDGEHVMVIRVSPDSIGPVRVLARIGAEGVRIELIGGSDAARDALRTALPDLRRDLAGVGLQANLSLGTDGQGSAGSGAGLGQGGRPGTAPGDRGPAREGPPGGVRHPDVGGTLPPEPTGPPGSRRLDITM